MLSLARLAAIALLATQAIALVNAAEDCRDPMAPWTSYGAGLAAHPELKKQLETTAKVPMGQWYTDQGKKDDLKSYAEGLFKPVCGVTKKSSKNLTDRPTVVVYGMAGKDCQFGPDGKVIDNFSSHGFNKNATDYAHFIKTLADAAGDTPVIYILEPDSVGLTASIDGKPGCGVERGYPANLKMALEVLGANPNADIYMDVGYWTLGSDAQALSTATLVKSIDPTGRCKGISLDVSNYRPTSEMEEICARFSKAGGKTASGKPYHCIVDTSRNGVKPQAFEWCNTKDTGMGALPTSNTNSSLIDYFVWVKPPGESDGECTGRTQDSMIGPQAGKFFVQHFIQLWNNGVFVTKKGKKAIKVDPKTAAPTPAPSTVAPTTAVPTTAAPTTAKPTTAAPTTAKPTPKTKKSSKPKGKPSGGEQYNQYNKPSAKPTAKPTPKATPKPTTKPTTKPATTTSAPVDCRDPMAPWTSYGAGAAKHPELKKQLEMTAKVPMGQWYTDQGKLADLKSNAERLFKPVCGVTETSSSDLTDRPTVVVYGMAGKDCQFGPDGKVIDNFSSHGFNKNATDYAHFINTLATAAGNKPVIYILEPDSVGLTASIDGKPGCGVERGYPANLKFALETLGANPNADIYMDVGYWTLGSDAQALSTATLVKSIDPTGRCKGISLDVSNYRPTSEMVEICARFSKAGGKTASGKPYHCIVDTSRNGVKPQAFEWCNTKDTGIGALPTSKTSDPLIDYYVWVKPPGESDGECTGRTQDSMIGPQAGSFFVQHFIQLWNNGVFVTEKGEKAIEVDPKTVAPTPAPSTTA